MKKFIFVMGIFLLILCSSIVQVKASNVDLEILDPITGNSITVLELCPEDSIMAVKNIAIFVTNNGAVSDTYRLFLDVPTGWKSQIQSDIKLSGGETEQLHLFWVDLPDPWTIEPGNYNITIKVISNSNPSDIVSKTLIVRVLTCHKVDLIIQEKYREVCKEKDAFANYEMVITNKGMETETFKIETIYNDELVNWAKPDEEEIILNPGKNKTVDLVVQIPLEFMDLHSISVKVKSLESYALDDDVVKFKVIDCFDFIASLRPIETNICLGGSFNYTLNINNKGQTDTFIIKTPDFVKSQLDTIDVPEGQSRDVILTVTPKHKGKIKFDFTVEPQNDPKAVETVSGIINANECRNVAVIVFPSNRNVCIGKDAEFVVTVKNIGSIEDTFNLRTTKGTLEKDIVTLKPREQKDIKLLVKTEGIIEKESVSITASSGGIIDESVVNVSVEDCYSANVSIEPIYSSVCPCSEVKFNVTVKNTGKLADDYTVILGRDSKSVSLDPGESKSLNFNYLVECEMSGEYNIIVALKSDNIFEDAVAFLDVKETSNCYGVELKNGEPVKLKSYESAVLPIKVKNTGERYDTFDIIIEGPDWVYVTPEKVSLESKDEIDIYIYLSPSYIETEKGNYTVKVKAISQHSESETLLIEIGIASNFTTSFSSTPTPEENDTTEEEEPTLVINETKNGNGIVLNATLWNNDTISYTPGEEIEVPFWKTAVIVVITLIIIIILIIRFVFLMK